MSWITLGFLAVPLLGMTTIAFNSAKDAAVIAVFIQWGVFLVSGFFLLAVGKDQVGGFRLFIPIFICIGLWIVWLIYSAIHTAMERKQRKNDAK